MAYFKVNPLPTVFGLVLSFNGKGSENSASVIEANMFWSNLNETLISRIITEVSTRTRTFQSE